MIYSTTRSPRYRKLAREWQLRMPRQTHLRRHLAATCRTKMQRGPRFVEIEMEHGPGKSYMTKEMLDNAMEYVILVVNSAETAWYLGEVCGATRQQVQEMGLGLCIPLGPRETHNNESLWPLGAICYMEALQDLRKSGYLTKLGNKFGKANYIRLHDIQAEEYRMAPTLLSSRKDDVECLLCCTYQATHRWNTCVHETDGPALLCLKCKNIIQPPGKAKPTECYICRQPGFLKSCKKKPGANTTENGKPGEMMPMRCKPSDITKDRIEEMTRLCETARRMSAVR